MSEDSQADHVAELEVEVEELRAKLEEVEVEKERLARARTRVAGFATGVASRALLGPRLVGSLKAWLRAKSLRDSLPVDETAELGAAIIRRWLRVGLWHLLLASGGAFTAGILIWQGLLIRGQIREHQAQNELIRSQVKQQILDTLIVRRAQLLDTIYEEVCKPGTGPDKETASEYILLPTDDQAEAESESESDAVTQPDCRPKAHARARLEAVLALAQIERSRQIQVNLRRANLSGLKLGSAVLGDANLRDADLSDAELGGTDLHGADLHGADLRWASLIGSDLREADLTTANLGDTDLRADLSGASLAFADLRGASISNAKLRAANLQNANLRGAVFISTDLRRAVFGGADLRLVKFMDFGSKLNPSNLSEAVLDYADIRGVDLSSVQGLTQQQLDSARGDENTILPEGLKHPAHWTTSESKTPEAEPD